MRKKLRVGEFQELGFGIQARIADTCRNMDALLEDWLAFCQANEWRFRGGCESSKLEGFLAHSDRGSLNEEDRARAKRWLFENPYCREVQVAELSDAWHR